jgi:hypothetical protein
MKRNPILGLVQNLDFVKVFFFPVCLGQEVVSSYPNVQL